MLEILALIFLTRKTGDLASSKGLSTGKWKGLTVLFWFLGEFVGCLIGFAFVGMPDDDGILKYLPFAYLGALLAYVGLYNYLNNKPDADMDDDIDKIGVDDLYPSKEN